MIYFYQQDTDFELDNEEKVSNWIIETFKKEGISKEINMSVIFNSDEALLEINKQFLNHDYYTDIITFPIEETDSKLEAELYISIDRVKENAEDLKVSFENELLRVIIHGTLHLCGFGDHTEEEEKIMRQKEDEHLLFFV